MKIDQPHFRYPVLRSPLGARPARWLSRNVLRLGALASALMFCLFLSQGCSTSGGGGSDSVSPPTFGNAVNLSAQSSDIQALLVCADFDRDGFPDVATVNSGGQVIILKNDGTPFNGALAVSKAISTEAGGASALATADIDNNGTDDLIVGTVSQNIVVFQSPAPGADPFVAAWTRRVLTGLPLGVSVNSVVAGDFDRDGFIDIAAGLDANNTGEVVLFTSPGTNFFTIGNWAQARADITTNPNVRSLAVSDLDRDGDLDLICGTSGPQVIVWQNAGGVFPANQLQAGALAIGAPPGTVNSVAAADLNLDGFPDVVSAGLASGAHPLLAWQNPGLSLVSNPFTAANWSGGTGVTVTVSSTNFNAVSTADINRDGFPDLVAGTVTSSGAEALVFTNDHSPFSSTWQSTDAASTSDNVLAMAAGDLDRDGQIDIVAGTAAAGEDFELIAVENSSPPASFAFDSDLANLDSSGTFDIRAIRTADLDFDGDLDFIYGDTQNRLVAVRNPGNPFTGNSTPLTLATLNDDVIGLAVSDFDRDGDADVILIMNNDNAGVAENDRLVHFRNDAAILAGGDGNPFDLASEWATKDLSNSALNFLAIASADFDLDGSPDVVTTDDGNVGFGSVRVWQNPFPGAGAANAFWTSNTVEPAQNTSEPTAVAVGDFDLDGDPDIVTGFSGGDILIFQNDRTPFAGTWVSRAVDNVALGAINAVAVADFNKDGLPDILAVTATGQIRLFQNPGVATAFTTNWSGGAGIDPINANLAAAVHAIAISDLDRDGDLDFVLGTNFEEDFEVLALQNIGTPFNAGTWIQLDVLARLDSVRAVVSADVNGDGLEDVVVGSEGGDVNELVIKKN